LLWAIKLRPQQKVLQFTICRHRRFYEQSQPRRICLHRVAAWNWSVYQRQPRYVTSEGPPVRLQCLATRFDNGSICFTTCSQQTHRQITPKATATTQPFQHGAVYYHTHNQTNLNVIFWQSLHNRGRSIQGYQTPHFAIIPNFFSRVHIPEGDDDLSFSHFLPSTTKLVYDSPCFATTTSSHLVHSRHRIYVELWLDVSRQPLSNSHVNGQKYIPKISQSHHEEGLFFH
jgi:hypothetical protein